MMTYKATNGLSSHFYNFPSLEAAEAYYLDLLGPEYIVTLADPEDQVPDKTPAEKLTERQVFGASLRDKILLDNEAFAVDRNSPLTEAENDALLAKFYLIMVILPAGNLQHALEKIEDVVVDTIYTQTRKDADILALTDFIAAQ